MSDLPNEAPRYPVGTIAEMAAIPDEALPRFLAELPAMIGQYRMLAAMNEMLALADSKIEPQTPIWIDDDKGIGTVTICMGEDDLFSIKTQFPIDPERRPGA